MKGPIILQMKKGIGKSMFDNVVNILQQGRYDVLVGSIGGRIIVVAMGDGSLEDLLFSQLPGVERVLPDYFFRENYTFFEEAWKYRGKDGLEVLLNKCVSKQERAS